MHLVNICITAHGLVASDDPAYFGINYNFSRLRPRLGSEGLRNILQI